MELATAKSYSWSDPVLTVREGVEICEFDDGMEQQSTYLLRMNNRHWRVSKTIYYILSSIDGKRTVQDIQQFLNDNYAVHIEEQQLEQIIEMAFIRNGILEGTTATTTPPKNKMMWGQFTLLRPGFIEKFKLFSFIFHKRQLLVLGSIAVLWLTYILSVYSNTSVIISMFSLNIKDMILCYLFVFFTGLTHEFGHSIAAMSYGVYPGRIGVGVYFVMPVLFSDVTRIWKIKRHQRVIVDLGGMYLQSVVLMVSYLLNILFIHSNLLNIAILLSGFTILGNFNPFIKFDGYWVLVDFLGITEVKTVLYQLWANLLHKLLRKPPNPTGLTKGKQAVLYIYSILTVCFFAYFIRFLSESFILAFHNIIKDVTMLLELKPSEIHITFTGLGNYLSARMTTFIVLFFFVNLIWRFALKKVLLKLKTRRTTVQEEVHCAAD